MEGPFLQCICCRTVPCYISLFRLVCTFSCSFLFWHMCTVLWSSLHLQSRDLGINLNSVFAKTILRGQTYESIRLGSYIFVSRFVVVLSFSAKKARAAVGWLTFHRISKTNLSIFTVFRFTMSKIPSIEHFHITSRRPYWCSKTIKRRPF